MLASGTYQSDCVTCEDDTGVKERIFKGGRASSCSSFGAVCDPVEQEIKDLRVHKLGYSKYPIVPFFDNGDATLSFFRKTKDYSPTHGSCIASMADYVLGGEFTVTRRKRPGFIRRNMEEVEDADFDTFIDFVESLHADIDGDYLLQVAKGLYENYKTYGNAFLKISLIQVLETRMVYIENIDAEKCRYLLTEDDEQKTILISADWKATYLDTHPPEPVPLYPAISDEEDGVQTTIIHLKNKVAGRDWYGQPESMSSMYFQFMEIQLGQYSTEGYANEFTPRAYIEIVSDRDDKVDWQEFNDAVDETFTNNGEKKRVITRRRGPNSEQSYIYEFTDSTTHEFHIGMSQEAERQIIKSHNWHKTLMGIPTKGSLGNEKEFARIYENKFKNVIRPDQKILMNAMNKALTLAAEFLNNGITADFSLDLANLHEGNMSGEKEQDTDNQTTIETLAAEIQLLKEQLNN